MEIKTEFEKKVRMALMMEEMAASDLAKELGITNSYLCDILKGYRSAPVMRKRICERLGLDEQTVGE